MPAGQAPTGRVARAGRRPVQGAGQGSTLYCRHPTGRKYWGRFRLVLVTNYREFLLVGEDGSGQTARLESFVLAPDAASFWQNAAHPGKSGKADARPFIDYLTRVLGHKASLVEPRDVAWPLAFFARDALGIVDGFADPSVYVLDPCCGTGAYLVEVLTRIERTLDDHGLGALKGARVRQAALSRIRGFEIMPAPFVVAHLQIGLFLQGLRAPLAEDERASVFLTNALTGWRDTHERQITAFPEFSVERELAAHVKRDDPILVVIGNPPYNAFAGTSPAEEEGLVEPYKTARPPSDRPSRRCRRCSARPPSTSG